MRITVIGGCGYVGSVLVPKLLRKGHEVRVWDVQWFGNYLAPHERLTVINQDIRMLPEPELWAECIIHLAGIANDPTGELDAKLTWETNVLATMRLAEWAYQSCVRQFIYASSGSVYGISDAIRVQENHPLNPISEYNKSKMVAERVLLSYAERMAVQIIRPATVCGWSPRMRLDVMVNALTIDALTKSKIVVMGGKRTRPNIHIEDVTDLYIWMLNREHLTGIWNAGFENLSVMQIARKVESFIKCAIVETPSTDIRSYRMDSDKLLAAGFKPALTVYHAIGDLLEQYARGKLRDEDNHYNLKVMKARDIH